MPIAGNPTGLNAEAISQVPIYTVMGTADRIMKISNVEVFLEDMDEYKAEYKFDIEDGWMHEDVYKKSYTNYRLEWVLGHTKGLSTGIEAIANDGNLVNVTWYSINGQRMDAPTQGINIVKYSDETTKKVVIL